jgi:hypothetical protein
LTRAKANIGLHHTAELTQLGLTFEVEFPKNQPGHEITRRAKACNRQRLTLQLLGSLNFRLHPKLHAGTAAVTGNRDDRRAFDGRGDHCIARAQRGLNAAAHQCLNRRGTRADVDQFRIQAVSLEGADLLGHPDGRHTRADGGVSDGNSFARNFSRQADQRRKKDRAKDKPANISQIPKEFAPAPSPTSPLS